MTALADGFFDIPAPFLMKDGQSLANGPETLRLEINGFLVTTRSRTILIDTGCGSLLGPTVNNLVDQLAIAGKSPSDIDAVLCTHIHPDHTNGLIDASGAAQFAHAQVFAPRNDLDFWLSDEEMARAPEALRIQFQWAQQAFAPYAGRITPFDGGEIIDGIEALPLFGHTPGHSGFHLDGGGNSQLIIWGDAVHDIAVQTRDPDVTVVADLDPDQARLMRHQIFDRVAADDALFAGMHVGFPGFGRLARSAGGFDYELVGQAR
ncbi:MBL fold metallo-hydrolase [Sphingomonas sp. S2-65]|uniref:MBL fold metallo-hydrolase n=1 Tax=Sphingomonas sp. S2-65 TaxID=2903960 RepID=UPI001F31E556|nr:MBL fold metallo-hydrolase [Sphingomonas sp. S2-65]UYY58101.1 MBL fold metallo-hydrolase [Sphingomonas sp. S2-65]